MFHAHVIAKFENTTVGCSARFGFGYFCVSHLLSMLMVDGVGGDAVWCDVVWCADGDAIAWCCDIAKGDRDRDMRWCDRSGGSEWSIAVQR